MNNSSTLLDFIFVLIFAYFMLIQPGQAVPVHTLSVKQTKSIHSTAISHDLHLPHFAGNQKRGITLNQIKYPFKQASNKAQRFRFATKEKYFELRSGMKFALGWHEEGRMFQAKADEQAKKYNNLFNSAKKRREDLIKEKANKKRKQ